MPVFKTTFTFTVFCEDDRLSAVQRYMSDADFETIVQQAQDGEFIGNVTVGETVKVPPANVRNELLAIGNDGDFFGS